MEKHEKWWKMVKNDEKWWKNRKNGKNHKFDAPSSTGYYGKMVIGGLRDPQNPYFHIHSDIDNIDNAGMTKWWKWWKMMKWKMMEIHEIAGTKHEKHVNWQGETQNKRISTDLQKNGKSVNRGYPLWKQVNFPL
jgi:hypothetical protein